MAAEPLPNPYEAAPLCVAQVDPETGRHLRAFFFLGPVPKAVLEAARRGRRPGAPDPRKPAWAPADAAVLRAHYGPRWQALLTAEDPGGAEAAEAPRAPAGEAPAPPSRKAPAAAPAPEPFFFAALPGPGAAEDDFWGGPGDASAPGRPAALRARGGPAEAPQDEGAFGDLTALDRPGGPGPGPGGKGRPAPPAEEVRDWARAGARRAPAPPEYEDLATYPEDTVHDLRLKLALVAGVAPFRQHLFYYVNEEGPALPYRLTSDGAPVVADWRALAPAAATPAAAGEGPRLAGLAVDPRLEERREGFRVEALDTFTRLGLAEGLRVTRAYFVDLYAVVPPLGAAERPNDGLGGVLRDRFQFDLLYHGALARYWPQLSAEAAALALGDPGALPAAFPALAPPAAALRARFEAERAVASRARAWRPLPPPRGGARRAETAVTAASVRVPPAAARMRVAARNVFDWVRTGPGLAAATVRLEAGDAGEAAGDFAGPPGRPGGRGLLAAKRHLSSYARAAAPAVEAFLARLPPKGGVAFAVPRPPGPAGGAAPFAFLAVHADGAYEATAEWREDDRVGFGAIAADLAGVVAPVLRAVNSMGAAAFPLGGALPPPDRGGALGAITASAFWPRPLSGADFRELKARFRVYERAGVVGVRGLQEAGAFAFFFRKGVTAYPPHAAERAAEAGNQYAWLCDPAAAGRWAAAFPGRAVRIFHRSADLRVEVAGADSLAEFELVRRYVFSFLDGLLAGPDRLGRGGPGAADGPGAEGGPGAGGPGGPGEAGPGGGRLRRLQEQDPDLFDLKKFDPGAPVYSVVCQSGRQPRAFSEAEAEALPPRRRGALVRYWNYTEEAPALYECPDPRFPHLSFRAGVHPLGFCLPCCKKAPAAPGSRAAAANAACLAAPRPRRGKTGAPPGGAPPGPPDAGDPDPLSSRHILAYGKAVPPGRLAEVPREAREGLFLDAIPPPYRLQLVGVEQAAPAVPQAGFAYALAAAAGPGGVAPDAVLAELADFAAALGDTFHSLGGGGGAAFPSAAALADAILGAFVRRDPGLSPFGPGGAAAEAWPDILAELARHAYGVEVAVLADPTGLGAVVLEASPEAAAALAAPVAAGAPLAGGCVCGGCGACGGAEASAAAAAAGPLRLVVVSQGPGGTYPLAALEPKLFLRVEPENRWMVTRRTFSDADPGGAGGLPDRVAAAVREALAGVGVGAAGGASGASLAALCRFASAPGGAFSLVTRLVSLRNQCYGVVLERRGAPGERLYFPVEPGAFPLDGLPAAFGARPAVPCPRARVEEALAAVNAFLAAEGRAPVGRGPALVDAAGRAVGFASAGGAAPPLFFHHDPEPAPAAELEGAIPLPYDAREVDVAVLEAARRAAGALEQGGWAAGGAGAEALARARGEAEARNRLYRLFVAEFAAAVRADRNLPLREALSAAIRGTRFGSAPSVAALRRRLADLLEAFPEDLAAVRAAVARAYVASPAAPAAAALAALEASAFAFDRTTIARLRGLPGGPDAVAAALRRLLAPRVAPLPAGAAPRPPPNVYVSCAEAAGTALDHPQCAGERLGVPAARLDAFYELLAADVLNPSKTTTLAAASAGVFEPLNFGRHPGEHLTFAAAP